VKTPFFKKELKVARYNGFIFYQQDVDWAIHAVNVARVALSGVLCSGKQGKLSVGMPKLSG
jgi:hypothetical protein